MQTNLDDWFGLYATVEIQTARRLPTQVTRGHSGEARTCEIGDN
jgi:hypothetical protein